MKKTILAMAVMLITGLTSAFAKNGEDVNHRAVASFNKDFASAKNVSWEQQKDFAKATFSLNSQVLFAYYGPNGQLLAVVRNVLSSQLPIFLQAKLKNGYDGHWISDLFEIDTQDQTSYYITLENSEEKLVLKSDGDDQWSLYKREKKNAMAL